MTKYTDDQINEAIMLANQTGKVYAWETEMYRNVINHLPEPGKTYITNVGIQQQIGRLQDLSSSENEAVIWLSTLNHLVATGADRKRILKQDTQDYWQECSWGDVLHTDARVKAEYISGTVIEGIPDGVSDDGVYLVDGNLIPYSPDAKWYRIPAQVVHPDPTEHPVILIHRSSGTKHDPPAVAITRKHNMTDDIHYVFKDYGIQSPADITEWEPAKVVADND